MIRNLPGGRHSIKNAQRRTNYGPVSSVEVFRQSMNNRKIFEVQLSGFSELPSDVASHQTATSSLAVDCPLGSLAL